MRRPKTLLSGGSLLLIAATLLAQDFQIRTRVDLVVVPFMVKGDDGGFVAGLGPENFTVLEDGKEQAIQAFSIDPVPLSAALVIDTGVNSESLAAVQESIPSVVAAFSEFDEVAVYRYDNRVDRILDFTGDSEVLRAGLNQLVGLESAPQFVGGGRLQGSPVISGVPVVPSAERPLARDVRVLHDAIYEAALALGARPDDRRRMILLVSDGNDTGSRMEFEENILLLLDTEIQVYAIGLGTGLWRRILSPLDNYTRVSGGDLYHTRVGSLQPLFAHIAEQARNQYVLTYVSTQQAPANKIVFRNIELRSNPPYRIVHKQGYYQFP